jgi:hypothetical protein
MTAVGDRILERLARIPMNGIALRMEIGCEDDELTAQLRALEEAGTIRRLNGKYHITPAAPIAAQEPEVPKVEEKVCTGPCGESKPVSEFYDRQSQCKRCVLNRQKMLKVKRSGAVRKMGGGSITPKRAGPRPAKVSAETPAIQDLAVIHTETGVRLGPLTKSAGGLIQMPYHVDLSWQQFDELTEWRKGMK